MDIMFVILWMLFFVMSIVVAQNNNRSVVIWVLVSLFFSPILSLICLWILGKNYED